MAEVLSSIKALDIRANTVVKATHVDLTASTTITPQTHGSRLLAVNKTAGSDITLTVDTAKAPGVSYHFVYHGSGVSGDDVIIACQGATDSIAGCVTHVDTSAGDAAAGVRANAGTHDKITVTTPAAFDITLTSNTAVGDSTASWIIGGTVVSATAPAFSST